MIYTIMLAHRIAAVARHSRTLVVPLNDSESRCYEFYRDASPDLADAWMLKPCAPGDTVRILRAFSFEEASAVHDANPPRPGGPPSQAFEWGPVTEIHGPTRVEWGPGGGTGAHCVFHHIYRCHTCEVFDRKWVWRIER